MKWIMFAIAVIGLSGCQQMWNQDWRADGKSVEELHYMDRYVWQSIEDSERRVARNKANPPTSWFDAATR